MSKEEVGNNRGNSAPGLGHIAHHGHMWTKSSVLFSMVDGIGLFQRHGPMLRITREFGIGSPSCAYGLEQAPF